jgi:RsmE family RNA methyltransferase
VHASSVNRILLEHTEVDSAGCATLVGRQLEHAREVLHVKEGNTLRVGLINGPVGTARVERVYAGGVDIRCVWERELKRSGIDLILALPRPKVMRRLWSQIAMLGVDRLFLIRAEKVERYYFDSHVLDPEVYEPLLLSGIEQAGSTQLPKVSIEKQFKPFIEERIDAVYPAKHKWIADPSTNQLLVSSVGDMQATDRVILAIGPEGGWTAFEQSKFEAIGFNPVGLGSRILRSDIAVVSVLSLLQQMKEARS